MIVVLSVLVTGSAEIVVTAGSSTDPHFVIADYLGATIAAVLKALTARGYSLTFVTEKFFICTKNPSVQRNHSRVTLFNRNYRLSKK